MHALQHLSFFLTAALFWWALVHGRYGRVGYGVAVVFVFTTAMHSGILGALITFGGQLWYPSYHSAARRSATIRWRPAAGRTLDVDPRGDVS